MEWRAQFTFLLFANKHSLPSLSHTPSGYKVNAQFTLDLLLRYQSLLACNPFTQPYPVQLTLSIELKCFEGIFWNRAKCQFNFKSTREPKEEWVIFGGNPTLSLFSWRNFLSYWPLHKFKTFPFLRIFSVWTQIDWNLWFLIYQWMAERSEKLSYQIEKTLAVAVKQTKTDETKEQTILKLNDEHTVNGPNVFSCFIIQNRKSFWFRK